MKYHLYKILFLISLLFLSTHSFSQVELAAVFSDNMVLQQQADVRIWGKSRANKEVKIITSWDNHTYSVQSNNLGRWEVKVKTPSAGGPYEIIFNEKKTTKLSNVLIGEVWICSGQSNMEMPLAGWGKISNYENEIFNADYPNIRLLQVKKSASPYPNEDVALDTDGWEICSPTSAANFSATAYFFGREIHDNLNVPIGLIHTSWGGTVAEAWTSRESLSLMPDFIEDLKKIEELPKDKSEYENIYQQSQQKWNTELLSKDFGFENNLPVAAKANFDDTKWKLANMPEQWENNILPNFDGVVWFRKSIEIPSDWENQDLVLSLGMIDDDDITYFNGTKIGATSGFNLERKYIVPRNLIKSGISNITVRVMDTGGGGGFHGEASNLYIAKKNNEIERKSLAGEWKYKESVNLKEFGAFPQQIMNNPNFATNLFNAMINPFVSFKIKGAIWYQGESNADRADQYRVLFPLLINDWRAKWGYDFPFYFVQLANFMKKKDTPVESDWAELREAQLNALHLSNTGMAVTIDIGDADDIHPKNKQDVGKRLALNALEKTYKKEIIGSGPIYKTYKIENGKIRIIFEKNASQLKINGSKLKGFSIAGPDKVFYWADAVIEGDEVIVFSPKVIFPVAVRYAWADNPECNLYNESGLPASPFRTDDW